MIVTTRLLFVTVVFLSISCNSNRVFEEFQSIDTYWNSETNKSFQFDVDDNTKSYKIVAQFKQDIEFPYYNFYFNYTLTDAKDSLLRDELREVLFYNQKTGQPLGKGIGDSFDHEYVLEDKFKFSEEGLYNIGFTQFMRIDSVNGIDRVGLRIEMNE